MKTDNENMITFQLAIIIGFLAGLIILMLT